MEGGKREGKTEREGRSRSREYIECENRKGRMTESGKMKDRYIGKNNGNK